MRRRSTASGRSSSARSRSRRRRAGLRLRGSSSRRRRAATREAKPLHILGSMNRDGVSDARRIDTLQVRTPVGGLIVSAGRVGERRHGRVVVVSEDAGPLLAGLVVVLRIESGVGAAVVDLHAGSRTRVSRVHVFGDTAPDGGSADDLALGTAAVPGVDLVAGGVEAAGADAGVDNGSCEEFGVCGCHDVLR